LCIGSLAARHEWTLAELFSAHLASNSEAPARRVLFILLLQRGSPHGAADFTDGVVFIQASVLFITTRA
jgi:hypothetical protein